MSPIRCDMSDGSHIPSSAIALKEIVYMAVAIVAAMMVLDNVFIGNWFIKD